MGNLATSLRRRSRATPMSRFDTLPPEARRWVHHAALPWSATSVMRIWRRALCETGSVAGALSRLDAAELTLIARDAMNVWGPDYPLCAPQDQRGKHARPAGRQLTVAKGRPPVARPVSSAQQVSSQINQPECG